MQRVRVEEVGEELGADEFSFRHDLISERTTRASNRNARPEPVRPMPAAQERLMRIPINVVRDGTIVQPGVTAADRRCSVATEERS